MNTLSIGKWRSLQQCATPRGAFAVLAIDHRGNLRRLLRPDTPDALRVDDADLVAFKAQAVDALASTATAVLLDPEFGAAQSIASGALPGNVGLLVTLEVTGYTGDALARQSEILPGWSVEKAKRMGAAAVKLLVYYHPDAPTAGAIESLVRRIVADCAAQDLPLFLEPLSYAPDPARKKLPPDERRRVVIETARRLTALGVDVLKAEFPLDITAEPGEHEWTSACAELTAVSVAPWVLLSASVDYETYLRQVIVACRAGASGVAAGRAVWQEAAGLNGGERAAFLRGPARERMARLTAVCNALARPWTDVYSAPHIGSNWHAQY